METAMSKVYVLLDERKRVLRCDGGYTIGNIRNIEEWTLIDEGEGTRFSLCQTHYFKGGLYTEEGVPRYKVENGKVVERTEEEIAEDLAALPVPEPTWNEQMEEHVAELEAINAEMEDAMCEMNAANQVEIAELQETTAALEDAICEMDEANEERMAAIEDALCEMDIG